MTEEVRDEILSRFHEKHLHEASRAQKWGKKKPLGAFRAYVIVKTNACNVAPYVIESHTINPYKGSGNLSYEYAPPYEARKTVLVGSNDVFLTYAEALHEVKGRLQAEIDRLTACYNDFDARAPEEPLNLCQDCLESYLEREILTPVDRSKHSFTQCVQCGRHVEVYPGHRKKTFTLPVYTLMFPFPEEMTLDTLCVFTHYLVEAYNVSYGQYEEVTATLYQHYNRLTSSEFPLTKIRNSLEEGTKWFVFDLFSTVKPAQYGTYY